MKALAASLALALTTAAASAQEEAELGPEDEPAEELPMLILPEEMEAAREEAGGQEDTDPASEDEPAPEAGELPMLIPPEEMEAAREAEEPSGPPMREVLAESEEDLAACLAALDELGVVYERADPIEEPDLPDCGIANPLTVSEIAPGVSFEPAPTMRCAAALAAAHWVTDVVLPLSGKLDGRGPLLAIDQGTSYLCRPRADGDLSEHAFGNALDVMGFRFESGNPIPVQPRAGDGTLEEAFQRAVRAGACLDFSTVLGPGSDADHADHLHLDVKARDGGFRICE